MRGPRYVDTTRAPDMEFVPPEEGSKSTYQSPPLSVREGVVGVLFPAAADANVLGGAILNRQAAVSWQKCEPVASVRLFVCSFDLTCRRACGEG